MKNKLFDDHVREQLSGLNPQVPPHIWENIAAGNRKKPAGIWGFFTGLNMAAAVVLVLVTAGLIFLFTENKNSGITHTDRVAAAQEPAQNKNDKINTPGAVAAPSDHTDPTGINPANPVVVTAVPDVIINSSAKNTDDIKKDDININTKPRADFLINNAVPDNEIKNTGNTHAEDMAANDFYLQHRFSVTQLLKTGAVLNPKVKMPFLPGGLSIPCPKAERDAAGNKKYIEVYGGPDYSFRSISDTGSAYAQQRKSTTKTTVGYSAGIRYTKVFNNGMSLRTGINYSRINENFTSVQGHVTHNVYITDNAGDTTGTYSVTGTQYKKSMNKFTSVDIPLMAGYEAGNGRLHTDVNGGVMVNIISRQSGFVEDKNGNPVDISSGKEKSVYQYKTNTGLSLAAAVSVYYKLNERLHVLAEPYFRYSLSPVTQSTLSLKQKYHTAGLRLGIRMDL